MSAPMIEHRNKLDADFREVNSRTLAEFAAHGYVLVRADDLAISLLTGPAPTAARRRLAAVLDAAGVE